MLLLLLLLALVQPVDAVHYSFAFTLSDAHDRVSAEATVTVLFGVDGLEVLDLDLVGRRGEEGMTVRSVMEGSTGSVFQHRNDRLSIRLASPSVGGEERTFRVRYDGIPADGLIISRNRHGDRTWFGDNWPNRARHWLPVVDHPSDKATVEFIITAPNHYQVVATGELVEETDLPAGFRRTHWRTHVPTATKVMVFGAARFAVQYVDEVDGVPVSSWVYPQDRDAGFFDYALAGRILRFFSDRIGPYPYEKLANVQSKTRYGGMENAGNIFYSEGSVTGDRQSEGLLAHEIAHQWFGDSVTEIGWFHIWLSEGFATYFTELYLEHTYGVGRLRDDMVGLRARVLAYADANPTALVVDSTVTQLTRLLNTNSYQKGAWVLHMLRDEVGDEAFWLGIRAYYRDFRDKNASSTDFRRVMERVSGRDLSAFFSQWLSVAGQPELAVSWNWDGASVELNVTQTQPNPFSFPLTVSVVTDSGATPHRVAMQSRSDRFRLASDRKPIRLELDPDVRLLGRWTLQSN